MHIAYGGSAATNCLSALPAMGSETERERERETDLSVNYIYCVYALSMSFLYINTKHIFSLHDISVKSQLTMHTFLKLNLYLLWS